MVGRGLMLTVIIDFNDGVVQVSKGSPESEQVELSADTLRTGFQPNEEDDGNED